MVDSANSCRLQQLVPTSSCIVFKFMGPTDGCSHHAAAGPGARPLRAFAGLVPGLRTLRSVRGASSCIKSKSNCTWHAIQSACVHPCRGSQRLSDAAVWT